MSQFLTGVINPEPLNFLSTMVGQEVQRSVGVEACKNQVCGNIFVGMKSHRKQSFKSDLFS